MSRVVRRGNIDYVVCSGCGWELDGTGTCPNDCLADDHFSRADFETLLREQREATEARRREQDRSSDAR